MGSEMCIRDSPNIGEAEEKVRMPGVKPGSQAWEACMMPLHYMRYSSLGSDMLSSCEQLDLASIRETVKKDGVMPATHTRGHCSSFWLMFPPLQVAPSFACSVASLSRSPGH